MTGLTDIPTRYQAIIYDQPGALSTKIVELDTPNPGVGDVLVRMTHSGVCRSDLSVMMRRWSYLGPPIQPGQVGGHEGVGEIARLGPGTERFNLKIGDRVGIKWMARVCGECLPCLAGRDGSCFNGKISGYETAGTFQQFTLAPANYVTPIPSSLRSDLAAPLLCGGVTAYAALKKCDAQPGDFVVIMGATGGLGHLALQIGSNGMGYRMIAVDYGHKSEFAIQCGAELYFDVKNHKSNAELVKAIKDASPGGFGATAVVVCTASNDAYAAGFEMLKLSGTLVCVGVPEGKQVPIATVDPASIISKEARVVGSLVGNREDAIATLDLAARGVINTRFRIEPMSNSSKVFEEMENMKLQGRVVLDLTQAVS
ncbi:alcohol dehydrogenase [Penicillium angulare]|uniref:Alcohol dehydrogenase n=1 Tax=Penicillium angulare TaxID=116970 RepID=A0A9W9G8H9_9EURO|nr:alcohol dehydrogenase [Penicillium angulare]